MEYKKSNNTYFAKPKDDVSIELGDSKQPDFKPQAKWMRWDNEVNLSVRLVDDEKGSVVVFRSKDKIKWVRSDKEIHFYDIPVSEEFPEGGHELEIVLKKKPVSNKIKFTLRTKGLDFFYQPPLTEEIKVGDEDGRVVKVTETDAFDKEGRTVIHRPENVVGSYAVYASEDKINYVGGKEYRAGKVGHFLYPYLIDAKGWKVRAEDFKIELNLEKTEGFLTVIIPQDFLDRAVYPIRRAAGLEFGYHTNASTSRSDNYSNIWGSLFTGAVGTGISISNYCYYSVVSGVQKFGLYKHSDLSFVKGTVEGNTPPPGPSWLTCNFTSSFTLEAIDYVVCTWSNHPTTYARYDVGSANQGHDKAQAYGETWPDPLSSVSHSSRKYGIYVTYTSISSVSPSISPSISSSQSPSVSLSPSKSPSKSPSTSPSLSPSVSPSVSLSPSKSPSKSPSISPSMSPSAGGSISPSLSRSFSPSISPSVSKSPSLSPSISLSVSPSVSPSPSPSLTVYSELHSWLPGWKYRKKITIDHTKVSKDERNFPVLVSIADINMIKAQADGSDFVFTSDDKLTKLSHEIESFDSVTGSLVAHVKVPHLYGLYESWFSDEIDTSVGDESQISDGWIEDDSYGWYAKIIATSASAEFDTAVTKTGKKTLKLSTLNTTGRVRAWLSPNNPAATVPNTETRFIPLEPNTSYTISVYVKTTNAVQAQSLLYEYSSNFGETTTPSAPLSTVLTGTNNWTLVTATWTTRSDTAWGALAFMLNVAGNVSDMWIDVNSLRVEKNVLARSDRNTELYLYYGNLDVEDQQDEENVWDSDYVLVSHLNDNPDTSSIKDVSTNPQNGEKRGVAEPIEVDGKLGEGQSFNGTSDDISLGSNIVKWEITGELTVEVWVYLPSDFDADPVSYLLDFRNLGGWNLQTSINEWIFYNWTGAVTTSELLLTSLHKGEWNHVVCCFKKDVLHKIYVNLVAGSSGDASLDLTPSTGSAWLGDQQGYQRYFRGILDEVRISKIARSLGWFTSEYNNQSSPSTFLLVGSEETVRYSLGGYVLPRPKGFRRSFISVSQDCISINGKHGRDIRLTTKERFELSWEMLSVDEVSVLLAIVEGNTPVIFFVNEENLKVSERQVLVYLNKIEYFFLGSDYYATVSLGLENVE